MPPEYQQILRLLRDIPYMWMYVNENNIKEQYINEILWAWTDSLGGFTNSQAQKRKYEVSLQILLDRKFINTYDYCTMTSHRTIISNQSHYRNYKVSITLAGLWALWVMEHQQ
jgi:hypothetical protein